MYSVGLKHRLADVTGESCHIAGYVPREKNKKSFLPFVFSSIHF